MHDQSRIACPRCGANNFPGQTHCFQCGSPLPPPEAIAAAGYAPGYSPAPGAVGQTAGHRARSGRAWLVVVPVVTLVLLVVVGLVLLATRRTAPAAPGGSSASDAARELDRLRKQYGEAAPSGQARETPSQEQAELQRLREKYNIEGPGGPRRPDGGGGSGAITFDQWQRGERAAPLYEFH